jgi:hypothetical protein
MPSPSTLLPSCRGQSLRPVLLPVCWSQVSARLLPDVKMSSVERSEKANRSTVSSWSILSVCRHTPLLVSHILTVRSYDADANRVESCEKATALTISLWLSLSVCGYAPSLASQILTVRSCDADISCVESREKATELIPLTN